MHPRLPVFSLISLLLLLTGGAAAHDIPRGTLPVGDGGGSTRPAVGKLFICRQQTGGGGAQRTGDWMADGTWTPARKPHVDGARHWQSGLTIRREGTRRIIEGNGLPSHPTGNFPVARNDDAYDYDRNPNSIHTWAMRLDVPAMPQRLETPVCTPNEVGIALTGVAIFNAVDAMGRDAPAYEIQDGCNGHPQEAGVYHYHDYSPCLNDPSGAAGKHSDLVGYAFDGFGIFGVHGEGGRVLRTADLDECHGHEHVVPWDSELRTMFHYHMTPDFPYTVGCFRGAVDRASFEQFHLGRHGQGMPGGGLSGRPSGGMNGPPPGAHEAMARLAQELGVDEGTVRRALGPPPPDFARAARMLGVSEERLRRALPRPRGN